MGDCVVVGAGPAGMACAYALAERGKTSVVIDKNDAPGGLCRTIDFSGYLFDIGGHRFISKSQEMNRIWQEVLGGDMLRVKRLSRIYYRNKYFDYPLSFMNTFLNLGFVDSVMCVASYFNHKYFRKGEEDSLDGWITKRFGKRLFDIFFKSYSEKVWGVSCQNISADWAKQRIRGLSLRVAVQNAILSMEGKAPKTLCEEFYYPRTGPGGFYKKLEKRIVSSSGVVFRQNKSTVKIRHSGGRVTALEVRDCRDASGQSIPVEYLFSTMPLAELVSSLDPSPPDPVMAAGKRLKSRSFVTVNVILDRPYIFSDQWLYIHSPEVKLARVQNYKNWSADMVKDPRRTSLGLEYFCSEKDEFWALNDVDLINYALEDLEKVKIAYRKSLISAFVVRCPNAYPIYHLGYENDLLIVRNYLETFSNLQTFGRGGSFRYDNSDRAFLSGLYAAGNFLGETKCDLWNFDISDEYLEA